MNLSLLSYLWKHDTNEIIYFQQIKNILNELQIFILTTFLNNTNLLLMYCNLVQCNVLYYNVVQCNVLYYNLVFLPANSSIQSSITYRKKWICYLLRQILIFIDRRRVIFHKISDMIHFKLNKWV